MVVSVFVSINFIISAADFKREHKSIFWLFDQLLVPNAHKGIPNNCFHVGDIFNVSKNTNLMVYFTNIFFLTFPESAGLLQSLQEELCLQQCQPWWQLKASFPYQFIKFTLPWRNRQCKVFKKTINFSVMAICMHPKILTGSYIFI